eukprot:TRINITY_DN52335_c0_g2_i1.p1 TRINITY_DN52335_c0_g2~~TRINITY_DN52335_c0_g2_i1.p1  ORF type:complete len:148 (+),score=20.76 TRINITY_DN52335_c0_g2_i1:159-602(+)
MKEEQHGLRNGRSCESQLLGLVDKCTLNMENRKQTNVPMMDFSKAFNKHCNSLLTQNLRHYGITGSVYTWISNYLTDRQQAVVVDGATSEAVPVESGVSQSSVLGPDLFKLYMNDLPEHLSSTTCLFNDEMLCHRAINPQMNHEVLQ